MDYDRHSRRSPYILVVLGVSVAALMVAGALTHAALLIPVPLLILVGWIFHSLTIEITVDELRWWFGSGLIHKKVPIAEIASAKVVRTSLLEGWGIHYSRFGWLYNVSGFDAVAIVLKSGKQFCLGSDEAQRLADLIQGRLTAAK